MYSLKKCSGAAVRIVTITMLMCTRSCNAEFQHAGAFACSSVRSDQTSIAPAAHSERPTAYTYNETSALHKGPSDLQKQLCTAGVSTYASSLLHESALFGLSKPAKHKALWPLSSTDFWAFGLAAVAIFIAAGGGIGGGGILVPLFASILGQLLTPICLSSWTLSSFYHLSVDNIIFAYTCHVIGVRQDASIFVIRLHADL